MEPITTALERIRPAIPPPDGRLISASSAG
jgi:hypothetical protein